LNITKHGSIALIITADEIRRVELTMSELELDQLLHFFDERGLGLIDYQTEGYSGFDSTLGRALRKLGDDLMTPVATCLTDMGVNRVALICAGRLNLLPLHASQWLCDGKTTTFMDNFVVSYLPNATVAFAKSAKALESSLLSRVVAFGNPTPCRFPQIPGAEAEVHAIGRLLQGHHPKIFCGENATRNTFLQFHQDATIFHFAGHGVFDEENALKSHLIFSNDEHLTVKDCLSHEIRPPAGSLAILSGCQTALVNFKSLPDEAIGLPASLLVAGFNQVIGSLWRVADQATALLMVRFYELLKLSGGQCCPSEALQRATIWFRDSTGAELNQFSCKHNLHFDPLSDDLYIRDYPSLWSAFIYVGL
jgi:CHAT domain-containing protein